jgi:FkbM family methyltransferase
MNWQRFVRKFKASWLIWKSSAQVSFSQVGEDLIIHYLFQSLNITQPSYLDVGTNHPIVGNNTYFFYLRGSRGVCIEPDPGLFRLIKEKRPLDTHINTGVGFETGKTDAEFYVFPHPYTGWNTFSKEESEKKQRETGVGISQVLNLRLCLINDVLEKHFTPYPNLLSLDVEGLDLAILQTIDFDRFKPEVICVESITFSLSRAEEKIHDIIDFIESKGYFVYADTHVNTIFCRGDIYNTKK